ncbi:hypothetical protein HRR83_005901 [Exophiala dermatitidis]|uniref:Bactericidal permeability-increasing protein n=1 Tax=Exophiala dermatitidis TaxID=5970 RepID=A0AAN6EM07_EXODE|nr:hypothetical protein HRR75_007455 [Exophiala dermatitidis]KAJ4507201.1 hypothetical protein HRR74_008124 [Exophiala dermatitidis]KAJ4517324.1 hypothetical protein HRR73_004376 [Exophiala dermatitidis]KAJ4548930.1 hypothetical protein HRR76_001505 [Exophiala dermatitidis]KAJ4550702.1 hypothetical protein HRR78_004471 [Exophiala dermatitidis]
MASVNRPTNTAVKEKDINTKLQLYGIFQAFSNGKVPSNKQIDVALNSFLESKALSSPPNKLSSEGRQLVADVREVVQQAKILLLSKNDGNLLQEFIWDAQHLDANGTNLPNAPTDKDTAKQHGQQALDGLKTLGRLILSNGQFRKLLNDATVLLRDMAGDAAQSAAERVNPSEDQLKQIDHPAEDNTWHDAPDLSKDRLKNQARSTFDKNKPLDTEGVKQAAREGADTAKSENTDDSRQAGLSGLQTTAANIKDQAKEQFPDEHKENARKTKDAAKQHTKNYLNNKIPQERRDQTIWRLKKMVAEIQGHSDYQEAIETLLSLAETYGDHAKNVKDQSAGTVKGAHGDDSLRRAEANLKTLIERFANFTSTDDFFDSLNAIYRDADRDPELKDWFKSVDRYIRKCLQEQGYILQDQATDEWNRLQDHGRYLLRDRYRNHTDRVLDEIKFLADQFDQDPQNKAFGDAVQKLFNDLGKDENGKPVFKKHLVKDLTEVIIPGIFENTRYVPIPRIEVSDPMIDAVVENLVIETDNLFPNIFEFGSDNYFRMARKGISNKKDNKITIAGSGIQMDLRDVAYYVKKKQGFPSITDKGVMDIFLGGEGFSFKIAARNAQKTDRTHFVAVDKVDVTIKHLNIKLKQSNHKLLFKIAKPLLLKVMRPVIQKLIEKQIKDNFEKADAFAYSVQKEVDRAKEAAKEDPENAGNIFQSYVNAVQAKLTEKKEKTKEVASKTNVNVAVTKQDSIFKHISLPGGISTKATEYKELAAKGDRWESPIFTIGSAKESTDIPKPRQVTRKPHSTTPAVIRGGNHPNADTSASSGYGSSGYGSTGPAGADNPGATTGYNTSGATSGYTNPGATSGFSNQVDRAFDTQKPVGGLSGTNGSANVTNGSTNKTFYDGVTQH